MLFYEKCVCVKKFKMTAECLILNNAIIVMDVCQKIQSVDQSTNQSTFSLGSLCIHPTLLQGEHTIHMDIFQVLLSPDIELYNFSS